MEQKNSYILKFFEVFFIILVIIGLSQYFDASGEFQDKVVNDFILIWSFCGIILLLSAIIAYLWHNSNLKLHSWFQTIIAFYLAYSITLYGSAKVLQFQFNAPNYILETPVGELTGFWLTWTYYSHSQTLMIILGMIQVIGSIFLIFRKTRLLATIVLLPVMVNIDLIDYFYDIPNLAYFNALHYTFMLIFLLLLDYDKLKVAFFSYKETYTINWKSIGLNLIRLLIIGGAFWDSYDLKNNFPIKTEINGVWKVEEITQKGSKIIPMLCQDSVFTKLYFEHRGKCIFKYNFDKFNDKKDLSGRFKVDENRKTINIKFKKNDGSKSDSLMLSYQVKDSSMVLRGMYNTDSLMMKLTRLK